MIRDITVSAEDSHPKVQEFRMKLLTLSSKSALRQKGICDISDDPPKTHEIWKELLEGSVISFMLISSESEPSRARAQRAEQEVPPLFREVKQLPTTAPVRRSRTGGNPNIYEALHYALITLLQTRRLSLDWPSSN